MMLDNEMYDDFGGQNINTMDEPASGIFGDIIGIVGDLTGSGKKKAEEAARKAQAEAEKARQELALIQAEKKRMAESENNKKMTVPIWGWVVIGVSALLGILGLSGVFNRKKRRR